MVKIESIIRPHLLDAVKRSLQKLGITGMTVTDVKGYGRQKGHKETYRGAEYQIEFVPKVKVEVIVAEELVDQAVQIVVETARTGEIGDGKIFISQIADAVRVRTGERGSAAL